MFHEINDPRWHVRMLSVHLWWINIISTNINKRPAMDRECRMWSIRGDWDCIQLTVMRNVRWQSSRDASANHTHTYVQYLYLRSAEGDQLCSRWRCRHLTLAVTCRSAFNYYASFCSVLQRWQYCAEAEAANRVQYFSVRREMTIDRRVL